MFQSREYQTDQTTARTMQNVLERCECCGEPTPLSELVERHGSMYKSWICQSCDLQSCDLPEASARRPEKRQFSFFGGNSKYEEEEEEEEEKPNKIPCSEQNDATVVELANTADMGLCYCHICKYEVLCEPSDLPDDKTGPIKFIAQRDEEEETLCRSYDSL
jgi:hypothetical protein